MIELLKGVRVVEKVESPGVGDYLRDFLGQIAPHHSPAHLYVNRNKLACQGLDRKGVSDVA